MTAFARRRSLPVIPASFFAMTLGLAETGNAWRFGVQHWGLPSAVGEWLQLLATASFIWWMVLYTNKWLNHRPLALAEMRDPVQSSFIALIPESLILLALALHPYQGELALTVFWAGSVANLLYGVWRLATIWSVQREPEQAAPPLLLTYTASVLVNALAAGLFGYSAYGWMLFGIGAISWLILDSILTQQLMSGGLAARTRNFMGIYMAPSVVALVAYQVLSGDTASTPVTLALCGYALFVAVAMLAALRWLREQVFAAGYWAYTFGVATLAQGMILAAERNPLPAMELAASISFLAAMLVAASVTIGTLRLWIKGGYYPPSTPVQTV